MLIMAFVWSYCPLYKRKMYCLMSSQSAWQSLHLLSNFPLPHLIAAQVLPSNLSHLQPLCLQSATVFWSQIHAGPLPDCSPYDAQRVSLFLTLRKPTTMINLSFLCSSFLIKNVAKFEIVWHLGLSPECSFLQPTLPWDWYKLKLCSKWKYARSG